jgi:CRP/FNR family transcriptional regulator, anaerobic regulatory protein
MLEGLAMLQHLVPKTTCSSCRLRDLCMPVGLSSKEMALIDQMVSTRLKIKRGEPLFRIGGRFKSLYTIRSGFFKTSISTADGREQVSGFYMAGELLGLDGLAQEQHTCTARALEDSEVCVLHVALINKLGQDIHALQSHVQKVMSREIVQNHDHIFLLGNMHSDARVATFILNLLTRLHARGQAQDELLLRMTREDIGSYLGLTIETVSRTLTKMAKSGLITVSQRKIHVLQPEALHYLAEHDDAPVCQQPVLPSHAAHAAHHPSRNAAYLM